MVAINQDAADTEAVIDQEATPVNPRYAVAEAIAERKTREMEEELMSHGLISAPLGEEPAAEPIQDTPPSTDPYIMTEDDLSRMSVRTKVDGQESVIPVADVLRTHQKDAAASNRLREANERLAAIEAREAALKLREAELALAPAPQAEPSQDVDALAERLTDAVFTGDREGTEEVFKTILAGRQAQAVTIPPQVDVASITRQVRSEISNDLAMKSFRTDFAEIIADERLAQVADTYLEKYLKDGDPFDVALTKAGTETREWVQSFAPPAPKPDLNLDHKVALKQRLDNPRAAQAVHGHGTVAIDSEQSRSQTIADMKAMREGKKP